MRPGRHDLHFLVGVELIPHVFVNIPDEKMHIGVFLFILLFIFFLFIYIFYPPLIPNVKCIALNLDRPNMMGYGAKDEDWNKLRFKNGDIIPNVESYFIEQY
jgi:hypothetical protein